MADTSIEWTHRDGTKGVTWNPTTGCDRISSGCDHCLDPNTRVLLADMTWVPIKDVRVGDRLVSFTDTPAVGQNRVWDEATVEAVWETEKPTIEIELANGASFIASEDHKWLVAKRGKDAWWRQTVTLNFKTELRTVRCEPTDTASLDYRAGYIAGVTAGDGTFRWDPTWRSSSVGYPQSYWRVAKLADDSAVLDRLVTYLADFLVEVAIRPFDGGPSKYTDNRRPMAKVETRRLDNMPIIASLCEERPTREWMAGYLAGMFDTDASYSGGNLRYCQKKPNDVLDRVVRYGKELGFEFQHEDYEGGTGGRSARLTGGIPENIAFLGAISPALTRRCGDFYGKRVETDDVPVVGIRRGSVRKLIDITTSTGTFIAEGALTHNCYALTLAKRLKSMGSAKYQNDGDPRTSGPGFGITTHPDTLDDPLKWRSPRTVFVNSMSDLFHAKVPSEFVSRVFAVMAATPQHTYQILSKRPERMARIVGRTRTDDVIGESFEDEAARQQVGNVIFDGRIGDPDFTRRYRNRHAGGRDPYDRRAWPDWPLPNAWLGTSVEDGHVERRIDHLRATPAAVRFLSLEPLLGPLPGLNLDGIAWAIIGGESGPGARPMDLGWVRDLIAQCRAAGVAPFVKQLGTVWAKASGAADRKGGNWGEWPADLRVREYPRAVADA